MAELEIRRRDPKRNSRPSAFYGYVTASVVTVLVAFFLLSFGIYVPLIWGPSSQPPPEPQLVFNPVDLGSGGNASWFVGAVQGGPYASWRFSMRLTVNGTSTTWAPLGRNGETSVVVVRFLVYRVVWTDQDVNGSMNPGDRFILTGDGAPLPSDSTFEFGLKWLENWISKARWSTS